MRSHLPTVLMFLAVASTADTEYPFANLPDSITAALRVDTGRSEAANSKLLGYNIFGFNTERERDFIRKFDPITIRFPHGVWANFYNWETDGYTKHGDRYNNRPHDRVLTIYAERNIRCGLPGLTLLNAERRRSVGEGFDMIWTYNLNYDDNAKSVARLRDSQARGLEVQDIEMGNEHFWKNQSVYERANWFCVNGVLNSFITISDRRVIKYPLEKTYYGAAYEIVRDVFEDARLLHGTMETQQLTTESGAINAVSARAVIRDGRITVLAVNLTHRPATFVLEFGRALYDRGFTHEALVFGDLAEVGVLGIDVGPLKPVKQGKGTIILPPLSISRISDIDVPHGQ